MQVSTAYNLQSASFVSFSPFNPAAGADLVWLAPVNTIWRPINLSATFTADANAGDRYLECQFRVGATIVASSIITTAITLGQTAYPSWTVGLGSPQDIAAIHVHNAVMPNPAVIHFGGEIRLAVIGAQVGDQLSTCRFAAWRFLTPEN